MTLAPQRHSARNASREPRCNPRRHRFLTVALALLLALGLAACGGAGEPEENAAAAPPPLAESGAETAAEECILEPPAEAMACTMEYDPVCGCDGKTYGNACMARGAGVPQFEPGECPGGEE